ncbi:MAG: hypothetical protein GY832_37840 [Chloroflexi bacterium]|nr:hypothetical protein [Chloroflexota bacterium]
METGCAEALAAAARQQHSSLRWHQSEASLFPAFQRRSSLEASWPSPLTFDPIQGHM